LVAAAETSAHLMEAVRSGEAREVRGSSGVGWAVLGGQTLAWERQDGLPSGYLT
jgi:hypothetical protein